MKKITFPTELAYIFGNVFIALGCALMEKSSFGVSMVVAPAYLIYRYLSPTYNFVTFGMAEYCLQAIILIMMCLILRKFRISYLFSFVTAVIYGFILDGFMLLIKGFPTNTIAIRIVWFILGMLVCSAGVSMMFHTYIAQEVYELFVKEVATHFKKNIHKTKTCYDFSSLIIGVILSFSFFGFGTFEGVKIGTLFCACFNGLIISLFTKLYEKIFEFKDKFFFRRMFEGPKKEESLDEHLYA